MAHAKLPNGSRVALGNRNPMLVNVRYEIARTAAVAVAVYDQLLNSLEKQHGASPHGACPTSNWRYRWVS